MVRPRGQVSDARNGAAAAGRRSALYWLLADIALTCPHRAFVERLQRELGRAPGDCAPLAGRLDELRSALPEADDAAGIKDLAVDYTRLFGGLRAGYGLPPPLESAGNRSLAAPEVAVAVAQQYAAAGFPSLDRAAPADHLGVELRFLSVLSYAEMQALQSGQTAEAARSTELRREFLSEHIGRWAPERWRHTAAKAEEAFYRLAAEIALAALLEESFASTRAS